MTLAAQIAVFLAATAVAVPPFRRFKLSAVLGYLAAGITIGPWGLCTAAALLTPSKPVRSRPAVEPGDH